jgi:hypothetical protein
VYWNATKIQLTSSAIMYHYDCHGICGGRMGGSAASVSWESCCVSGGYMCVTTLFLK